MVDPQAWADHQAELTLWDRARADGLENLEAEDWSAWEQAADGQNGQERQEFEARLAEGYQAMAGESTAAVVDWLPLQAAAAEGVWRWNEAKSERNVSLGFD